MINKFPVEKGVFCFLVNLRNYLRYYRIPTTESWLGGMLGCYGFYYDSCEHEENIHGRNGTFESIFGRFLALFDEPLHSLSINPDWDIIDLSRKIDNDKPILIWLNDYYLKNSIYYGKMNTLKPYILLSLNDKKAVCFDNGLLEIPSDSFIQALKHENMNDIYWCKFETIVWSGDDQARMREGLKKSANRLQGTKSGKQTECYSIQAISSFAKDLETMDKSSLYNTYFQMNRPGGLALSRDSLAALCTEIKNLWHTIEIGKSADLYSMLCEQWRKIANLLFRLSNIDDDGLRGRIIDRINSLIAIEYEAADTLLKISNQL